jgi:hypothetical protein
MPVVPTVNAPSVAPIQLPGATEQTPTRFLAESQVPGEQLSRLGTGMLKAGEELMAEATRQQININEAAAKDYDTKLMAGIQSVLYGTKPTPRVVTSKRRASRPSTPSMPQRRRWARCRRTWPRTWTTRRRPNS